MERVCVARRAGGLTGDTLTCSGGSKLSWFACTGLTLPRPCSQLASMAEADACTLCRTSGKRTLKTGSGLMTGRGRGACSRPSGSSSCSNGKGRSSSSKRSRSSSCIGYGETTMKAVHGARWKDVQLQSLVCCVNPTNPPHQKHILERCGNLLGKVQGLRDIKHRKRWNAADIARCKRECVRCALPVPYGPGRARGGDWGKKLVAAGNPLLPYAWVGERLPRGLQEGIHRELGLRLSWDADGWPMVSSSGLISWDVWSQQGPMWQAHTG